MDFGIRGRAALVCAGSRGIGRACAEVLSAEGARVVVCARDEETLSRAAVEISAKTGSPVLAVRADLTRGEEIDALFARIAAGFGTLHILVNNPPAPPASGFLGASDEDWTRSFHLNFLNPAPSLPHFLPFIS